MKLRYFVIALTLFCFQQFAFCQSAVDSIAISDIQITGLDKTKPHIVKRELDFNIGDQIAVSDTHSIFTYNEQKIFNTGLFITTNIDFNEGVITIQLKERWYIFPFPIFELADRNFNEWWQQRGRDLGRIEYGLRLYHNNVRGRNEKLKLVLQQGFTPKYELFYTIPYINKKLKTGIKFSLSFSQNKQVAYATVAHKLAFVEGEDFIRKRFYTGISLIKRKNFYITHQVDLLCRLNTIGDTITDLNPSYFLDSERELNYLEFKYSFDFDKRDIRYYPLSGYRMKFSFNQLGLGAFKDINVQKIELTVAAYKPLGKGYFLGSRFSGKISSYTQPYFTFRSLGYYENLVRGYELFPIDGQNFSLLRTEFKKQWVKETFNIKIPFSHFKTVPFGIYLKTFVDMGHVNDYTLPFMNGEYANTYLLGGGVGMDFVTYYDLVMRAEYSFNRHGNHGFYLHFKAAL